MKGGYFLGARGIFPPSGLGHQKWEWFLGLDQTGLNATHHTEANPDLRSVPLVPCTVHRSPGHKYDGQKSDFWSMGVLYFGLNANRLPFNDTNLKKTLQKVFGPLPHPTSFQALGCYAL